MLHKYHFQGRPSWGAEGAPAPPIFGFLLWDQGPSFKNAIKTLEKNFIPFQHPQYQLKMGAPDYFCSSKFVWADPGGHCVGSDHFFKFARSGSGSWSKKILRIGIGIRSVNTLVFTIYSSYYIALICWSFLTITVAHLGISVKPLQDR